MKYRTTTTLNQIGSQLNGEQRIKAVQSDQKLQYFESKKELEKEKLSTTNIIVTVVFYQRRDTVVKLHELHLEMLPHPPHSPNIMYPQTSK